MGQAWFFFVGDRPKLPLGQIISATLNHATCVMFIGQKLLIKTLAAQKFYEYSIHYLQI